MSSPILFLIACLIWGSTFFAITLQLGDVPPAVSVVYRFALSAAVLFGWCLARGDRLRMPWRVQRWMLLQGCATFGISYRYAMWLNRPPTRMYWRRCWREPLAGRRARNQAARRRMPFIFVSRSTR